MKLDRFLLAAVVVLAGVPAVQAQTVIRPAPPLDSARAGVRDAVLVLRDSLQVVHAGGARMQRDFQSASPAALVSRARGLRDGCAASVRTVPITRGVIAEGPAGSVRSQRARDTLLAEMDRLSEALVECRVTFGRWVVTGDGEAVRGYGNRGAEAVRARIHAYEEALQLYLTHHGIRIQPLGAGPPLIQS